MRTFILLLTLCTAGASAQETLIIRPAEIDEVLVNPGIGFMTFQRFNGDQLNEGLKWTEGYPIVYQPFKGSLENPNHPATSIAYFRVYWRFLEPEQGKYRWDLIDGALRTAQDRRQTLMLRVAPYGTGKDNDVPDWYRALVGSEPGLPEKWRTNPEDARYAQHFGRFIRAMGARYDAHPGLESVDLSIVGAWGEGAGSADLTDKTRTALVDAYLESFTKTPLVMLLTDEKTNKYGLSKRNVGWRVDCLGDMGGFSNPNWSHMQDYYPQGIINFGMQDAWKKAPVSLEVCWVMNHWKNKGWDVNYIIDQSLKWHISSFNAKSSAVPDEWWPHVNRWLKKMGYRFVLRKFTTPAVVAPYGKLPFTTWWENKGVAPIYKDFPLALRLKGQGREHVFITGADIREWLPGDNLYDSAVIVPADLPEGEYELAIGIVDRDTHQPRVKLAIAGMDTAGWYPLTKIRVAAAQRPK